MSRILLVDDSSHAQRMGERILSDEGYEVVAVSNADSALIRLEDVDPDVVIADVVMPGRTGYEICQYLKMNPRHRRARVILTVGSLESFDEEQLARAGADGFLKKPFEASALLAAVKPLAEAAASERAGSGAPLAPAGGGPAPAEPSAPFVAVVDSEQVRAAVTIALDAAMETMAREIAGRVLAALQTPEAAPTGPEAAATPVQPERQPPKLADPPAPAGAPAPRVEAVRRVTTLRTRPGSILGLDLDLPEPQPPDPESER
ncbi:MAG: response regulator [Bryobacteraceae bacterium]|jgi:CheY-like chemotaxis protein